MNDLVRYSDFRVEPSRPEVMNLMECYEQSPVYEQMTEEYEEIKETLISRGNPQALFCFCEMPEGFEAIGVPAGAPVVFSLITEGPEISRYSTEMFAKGDYVKGMIADAVAGSYLFQLEKQAMERLRRECAKRHVGIVRRLEAPANIPMEAQMVIFEKCRAKEELGMGISSGYMFDPVKSSGQIFVLSEDEALFRAQHDCRTCTAVNCKMRKVPNKASNIVISVKEKAETYSVECREGQTIMEALLEHGKYISAFCGGRGACGKCRVRVTQGNLPITESDEKVFTETELAEGWRLSCKAVPKEACTILLNVNDETKFETAAAEAQQEAEDRSGYGIACDIGTTTIAMSLTGKTEGKNRAVYTSVNHQRMYGADVITRIQASNEGKGAELQNIIRKELRKGIRELLKEGDIPETAVREMAVAGNTTMGHLLMGFSCETLGVFPFTPVNIRTIIGSCEELLGEKLLSCPVTLMPGISTYVGADITAGMLTCGMAERDGISLLIDLGTNGEMAIGNKERILVTSVAAGPAFEGGNISCGMGSVPGAICSVQIKDGQTVLETIGDQPPVGLCGTGVIETAAELVREGLVDETGRLEEELEDGFCLGYNPEGEKILFTGKDVREIQLAKSAVRAGVETLLLRYGITYEQVEKVYLAGGFGLKINQEKAIEIGMLPGEFRGKIEAVGNGSLSGAIRYFSDETAKETAEKIVNISEEVSLSSDRDFNEFYMDYMFFE